MRRWNRKRVGRVVAFTLCAAMLMGSPSGMSFVHATEGKSTEATVEDGGSVSNIDPNGTLGRNSDVGVTMAQSVIGNAGSALQLGFYVKSTNTSKNVQIKGVYPVIDTAFPFETSGDAYKVVTPQQSGQSQILPCVFKMKARADLTTGYHSVKFICEYSREDSTTTDGQTQKVTNDYYVIKTINIYFNGTAASTDSGKSGTDTGSQDSTGAIDGDMSGLDTGADAGGSISGGSGTSTASAPKLLITGYETNPKKLMAGDTFRLTVHIQNTSKSTSVKNAKFLIGNEAGNFLPTSGSSAVFLDEIAPGKTGDLVIEMKTPTDLAQKNYILMVKGDFDDGKGNNFTSSDSLYIPVYQQVKLAVTDASTTPEVIGVGAEGSLIFTINNQGSAGVYNVNVSLKDDAATAEETYVGNIAANSSSYVTMNITGAQDNADKGTVNVVISYEDADGNTDKIEQEVACYVSQDGSSADYSGMDGEMDGDMMYDETDTGSPVKKILLGVLGVLALVIVVTVVVILVKKKKKAKALLDVEDGEDDLGDEDF